MQTRTLTTAPLFLSATLLTVALGACGGASPGPVTPDPETPVPPPNPGPDPISEANAVELANVATSMADVLDSAGGLGSLAPLPIPTIGFQGDGPTEMCPDGGTIQVNSHDEAPEGESSPGDYWEIVFSQCRSYDTTIDGLFSLTLTELAQTDSLTRLVFTWAITALHVSSPERDCTKNASLSWGVEVDSEVPRIRWGITGSWSTTETEGGASTSRSLTGLDVGCELLFDSQGDWIKSYWYNGTYETSEESLSEWSYTVATLANFVVYGYEAQGPAEGKMSVEAGGDTLYLTAQSDEVGVLLELDDGSDGSIDWTRLMLWSEL